MSNYQPYTEYSVVSGGGFETNHESRTSTSDSFTTKMPTCVPVTIKQILESTQEIQDGPFVSHGQELVYVSFVGVIRNITDHTSNIVVTVEDGTGQLEVRKWSDNVNDINAASDSLDSNNNNANDHASSQIAQQYQIGTYVKVHGALKDFGGKKNIQYSVITNINSFNEVLTHHLEAIKWHAIAIGKLPNSNNQDSNNGQSLFVKDTDSGHNTNNGASNTANAANAILEFCRKECAGKDANQFAVPIQLMVQSLNLDESVVRECCTTLTEQGFIYPTFDDDNYFAL